MKNPGKTIIKPKSEWNIYEQRVHLMLSLMKISRMLKSAKIKFPEPDNS
jgi:hypothetical protein